MAYINDFGQKIGGAKKDLWKERGLRIEDLNDIDLREYLTLVTKDNIWPSPNYEQYLKNGMEPVCILFMKNVRDKIQAKMDVRGDGNDRDRAERYIEFLQEVKESCESVLKSEDIKKMYGVFIEKYDYKKSTERGWTWTIKARNTPALDNNFLSYLQTVDVKQLLYEAEVQDFPHSFRGDLKGINIRKSYYDGGYYLVKGDKVICRDKKFKSIEEALSFAKNELKDILDGKKENSKRENRTVKVVRPQLEYIVRTGPDLRKGQNASTEHLLQAFKFRGGEFGNWNTQEDRQAYINYAFDALVDLAYVLKCPLEFIGFDPHGSYKGQMLAIAFGARGSGTALAHYECGRIVINLTKMKGAGCLAHEWGHAFDDFLGVNCGVGGVRTFLSSGGRIPNPKNENIIQCFKTVMDTIKSKSKTDEEILAEYNKEIDRYINRILKSWIDSELRYFSTDNGGRRRIPTEAELELMESYKAKLYETKDKAFYDKIVELYKEVKGILPGKEMRDTAESVFAHVGYIKRDIELYNREGKFQYRRQRNTDFYKCAEQLDKGRQKPYYTEPCELFARAFEAYVEDKLGFKSQYLVHSTKNNVLYGDLKPYPEGEERQNINKAIDELVIEAVKTLSGSNKMFNFSLYEKNEDWSDKYSTKQVPKIALKSKVNTQQNNETPEDGKVIESALIVTCVAFDKKMDQIETTKVTTYIEKILSELGKNYYAGHSVKNHSLESEGNTIEVTIVTYEGLVIFNKALKHNWVRDYTKNKIEQNLQATDSMVKIISPQLENIVEYSKADLNKYTMALAKATYTLNNVKAIPKQEVRLDTSTINDTKDLREYLVQISNEAYPTEIKTPLEGLYTKIKHIVHHNLQLGKVVEGSVPYEKGQGNSKAWRIDKGNLVVNRGENISKKVEGVLEPVIKILTIRKFKDTPESDMISSGVTYMICKKIGLDVRTYCLTEQYERLVTNKIQIQPYVDVCKKMYIEVLKVLGIN